MDDLGGLSIAEVDWSVAHESVGSEGLLEDRGVDFSIPRGLTFPVEVAFVGARHQCLYPVDWRQVVGHGFGLGSRGFVSVECESWNFGISSSQLSSFGIREGKGRIDDDVE